MNDDWPLFAPPSQDQLARHADDLMHRANLVRTHGWDEYRHVWSCGEFLGVALVLGDDAELQRRSETTASALNRWAFDLWGITGGQADTDAGLPRTRAWFASIRAGMDIPSTYQPPATR
ncbi:hypothetical protein [Mycolicibacterium elephantis]|uniref:Uncharacterized protein n=1 Tax=Mycolicibacterium elephantis DSM 44368 TaxID=1335622 RepID=A0A439DN34_9MYCO|nr:hypothetical protein [Mycolicibacterium elephantis]MCV7220257.1 hypothetical protein [Mycolicibacterium elephantis]RWA16462.1 hypothetical protein MELE44368_07575 [Mycolicibacterium elephantis DSM 44368]